jgi:hypothetical protein
MGGMLSLLREFYPPASAFKVEDIPDLSSKVMIVTGGNTGIGKETVKVYPGSIMPLVCTTQLNFTGLAQKECHGVHRRSK